MYDKLIVPYLVRRLEIAEKEFNFVDLDSVLLIQLIAPTNRDESRGTAEKERVI